MPRISKAKLAPEAFIPTGRNAECKRCSLCKTSVADQKELVCLWGSGNPQAKVMLVGEAPGKAEILQEQPFMGEAGDLLSKVLIEAGLKRSDVYSTNSIKCRPPLNRVPKPLEQKACNPYVDFEIRQVKPAVIGLLGATALKAVTGLDGISKLRGKPIWSDKYQCWCIPTWHPAFILRNGKIGEEADQFKRDIAYIKKVADTGDTGQLKTEYTVIDSKELFTGMMLTLNASTIASVDTETHGDYLIGKILTVQFSVKPGTGFVIPFYKTGLEYTEPTDKIWNAEDEQYIWTELKNYLENVEKKKCGQNIKYDYQFFKLYGIRLRGVVFDTMLGHYLLNENAKGQHDLGTLALKYTDMGEYSLEFYQTLGIEPSDVGQATMIKAPPEALYKYGCKDADATLRLYCVLAPKVTQFGLMPLLQKVMVPMSLVLADMELTGVLVDLDYYKNLAKQYEENIAKAEIELKTYPDVQWLERHQQKPVNFNSSDQMRVLFYELLKLPIYKYTSTKGRKNKTNNKPSTDKESLEHLAEDHPLPGLLLKHRKLAKFYSTYVKPMPDLVKSDGRLHTSYQQHVTVTGRLSSSNPNLQNIPKKGDMAKEIRAGIIAPPGYKIVEADLGQIEFRLLANQCKDPVMLADLSNPSMDIHRQIASIAFRITPEQVSQDLREKAKTIVYSIIYGKGAENLAKQTGLGVDQVQAIFGAIYKRYPMMKQWMDTTAKRAETVGEVIGWTGRRRRLAEGFKSGVEALMAEARRQGVNAPIQGGAHDLMSINTIKVKAEFTRRGLHSRIVMTIHDALIVEAKDEELKEVIEILHTKMTDRPPQIIVPLTVDIAVGLRLAETEKLPKDYFTKG
jgi:DNA polymerase-1